MPQGCRNFISSTKLLIRTSKSMGMLIVIVLVENKCVQNVFVVQKINVSVVQIIKCICCPYDKMYLLSK